MTTFLLLQPTTLQKEVEKKKPEPTKPSKLRDTGEDINVGPSQYSFLGATARREQEMADAEDDGHRGRRFNYRDRLDEMTANGIAHFSFFLPLA